MSENRRDVELSVIVPVGRRHASAAALYGAYKAGLEALGVRYEMIFVLDGAREDFAKGLKELLHGGERFTAITLTRQFGEATALMVGFERAAGDVILTLPAYHQVDPADFQAMLAALGNCEVAIAWRHPRADGVFGRLRRSVFHGLLGWVTRKRFHDLGCGVRAFDRRVLEEIQLYGDQHRFLALLADRQGFRVREVQVRQSPLDRFEGVYAPREYTRGFLDIVSVFFLVRFTKRPLRFFGMIGVTLFVVGALLVLWLVLERVFLDQALAGRPALLLSSLLVVLGLQLFALGLLGELIIFTHARDLKDYQVERVIQLGSSADAPALGRLARPQDATPGPS